MTSSYLEGKVIQFSIVGFWALFWIFNVVNKFIPNRVKWEHKKVES